MKEENEFLYAILKTKNNIIKINKFPFSIGRAKNNDLCLVHKSISKQHAMFQMANYENEQSIILVDLNSLNGVYVNGSKIVNDSKIAVNTGDKIKFGNQPDIYIFEIDKEDEVINKVHRLLSEADALTPEQEVALFNKKYEEI